jgi:hypothetical protein
LKVCVTDEISQETLSPLIEKLPLRVGALAEPRRLLVAQATTATDLPATCPAPCTVNGFTDIGSRIAVRFTSHDAGDFGRSVLLTS